MLRLREVNVAFKKLDSIYQPDKRNSSKTFTLEEGSEKFENIKGL